MRISILMSLLISTKRGGGNVKTLIKSEFRELMKTKSLREIGKIYDVSYERIRQIAVGWGIARRGWKRIELVDDE